jgi:hypothetical protein
MKRFIALSCICLIWSACSHHENPTPKREIPMDLMGFEKMQGTWISQQGNVQFTENWVLKNDRLFGKGYLIKDKDTAFGESLVAEMINNRLVYIADVKDQLPILFACTNHTSDQWVFENPEHDFPKKITYTLKGTQLNVLLEGLVEDNKPFKETLNFIKK